MSLYSKAPSAFKWQQLTWEENFQVFDGLIKEDGVEKQMRYMSLPAGAIHVPMGPNQWLMDGDRMHMAHSDNPFICKLRYKNDLDESGNPKDGCQVEIRSRLNPNFSFI